MDFRRGGTIVWGIVPTNKEPFERETMASLIDLLENTWQKLYDQGLEREYLLSHSLLSPATCCLVNPDGEKTVDLAFEVVRRLSQRLRE